MKLNYPNSHFPHPHPFPILLSPSAKNQKSAVYCDHFYMQLQSQEFTVAFNNAIVIFKDFLSGSDNKFVAIFTCWFAFFSEIINS